MAYILKLVQNIFKPTSAQPREDLTINGNAPETSALSHRAVRKKESSDSTYYRDRLNKEIQMRHCQNKSSRELVIFEDEEEAKMLWKDIFEPLNISEILQNGEKRLPK